MLLQGIHDGRLYATDYRALSVETAPSTFEARGRLPNPTHGIDGFRYRLRTTRGWKSAVTALTGYFPSVAVEQVGDGEFVATSGQYLFASGDGGRTWSVADSLPASSGPMGVLPSALCTHSGSVYLGEYPLADSATPRIRRSDDGGQTWQTVTFLPEVRHVHAVTVDPFTDDLWVTTGDADAECQIGRLKDGQLHPVGGGSQRWRAVELAFTPSAILWGMDCVYADENLLLKLPRCELDAPSPSPEPVHTLPSSVYYSASWDDGGTRWIAFSTAVETTPDSTATDSTVQSADRARVVAASAASDFSEWVDVCSYAPRRSLGDRLGVIPSANTYLFLAADDERGLVVNPYNTARDHGQITRVSPRQMARIQW
jgi:hypothetical protein